MFIMCFVITYFFASKRKCIIVHVVVEQAKVEGNENMV